MSIRCAWVSPVLGRRGRRRRAAPSTGTPVRRETSLSQQFALVESAPQRFHQCRGIGTSASKRSMRGYARASHPGRTPSPGAHVRVLEQVDQLAQPAIVQAIVPAPVILGRAQAAQGAQAMLVERQRVQKRSAAAGAADIRVKTVRESSRHASQIGMDPADRGEAAPQTAQSAGNSSARRRDPADFAARKAATRFSQGENSRRRTSLLTIVPHPPASGVAARGCVPLDNDDGRTAHLRAKSTKYMDPGFCLKAFRWPSTTARCTA